MYCLILWQLLIGSWHRLLEAGRIDLWLTVATWNGLLFIRIRTWIEARIGLLLTIAAWHLLIVLGVWILLILPRHRPGAHVWLL